MKSNNFVYNIICVTFFVISILLVAKNFILSAQSIFDGRSLDLRNRIVGTRVALLHKDPYTYQEPPNGDPKLIDPISFPSSSLTRLSISPAVLLSHTLYSNLAFSKIIYIWFGVEWLCLALTLFLLMRIANKQRGWILFLISVFFTGSTVWILHLLNGQIYVVYALILAFVLYLIHLKKYSAAFFIIGVLCLIRPPLITIPLVLFSVPNMRKYIRPFVYGLITLGLLTAVIFNPHIWGQYISGMSQMTKTPATVERNEDIPQKFYSSNLEGWSVPQHSLGFSPEFETSVRGLVLRRLNRLLSPILLFSIIIFINLGTVFIVIKRKISKFIPLFTLAVTAAILSEYFIPARRYVYADVLWLIPMWIGITLFKPLWIKKIRI